MSEYAIEFRDVCLAFGEQKVLDGVSFGVHPGETKILMGGSGTGKSTVLKLVLGLLKPDSGRIFVDNEDITDFSESQLTVMRQKIGMVFQEGALFDSLSVYENVGYRLFEQGADEEEIEETVRRMLRFVNLEQAINKMPSELSGGMRRRVGIARALVGNPKIILYDEPTAGLDPPTARTICELAIKLRDLEGVSSLFVTHRIQDAVVLADHHATIGDDGEVVIAKNPRGQADTSTQFIMLRHGKVLLEGDADTFWNSTDPYIRTFLELD
ncbi:ABC transporter ATP-binding protein [Chloracidobacterium aggregatum]|uniref:ATP-binding cassette domain-containing protein n=1 Tax=Chloracidobacterium sp. N TaxID=2821540 RepID=A0ABX8AXQ2_9BACT|nr:ATP-binding cassette domain-containing protein [Chloracidobacterium aggregatum]QUV84170.1 ATP-binding cassette domain-containing protein [Chloracidobacterium sp. 2]QUV87344.1 ATP-binding cassette domain-containing protein [Chloracidobacterium sp. S]QUV90249.1 ATP-binding cassette domain-containing protein [Chloracidobacterium sp. A]QUV93459.1 ATP-binding cassette domain-containing protein [Chloracidobacterium sp. N]QUV96616.1 ATP-binding cassette domain-containing protein [Chloracidobacteri